MGATISFSKTESGFVFSQVVQMLQGHESDALRRLRETEPGSSGRESLGSLGVLSGDMTSAELTNQPGQVTNWVGGN